MYGGEGKRVTQSYQAHSQYTHALRRIEIKTSVYSVVHYLSNERKMNAVSQIKAKIQLVSQHELCRPLPNTSSREQ